MNKAQRKRRAQEMKRKAKLAKRARREDDANSQDGIDNARATDSPSAGGGVRSGANANTGMDAPSQDDLHRAHAKMNWAEADALQGELAARLGDDEAVELLTKAARALGDVIDYVQDVLQRIPKDLVAEAVRQQSAPRVFGDKSRNGSNPVVQLLGILLRAKALMIRVVKQTNPELAKRMKAQL